MKITEKLKEFIPRDLINFKHRITAKYYTTLYNHPASKLAIIGVTGTDGKTTTCTLIYEILREAGYKVGLITTISARLGDETIPTGFHVTTPSPRSLQKLLSKMVDNRIEFVILETTSHALDQYRIGGIDYHAGIYTNISHEHIDYHGSYEAYLNAKAKLIDMIAPGGFLVVNHDDDSSRLLIKKAKSRKLKTYTYGFDNKADLYATNYKDSISTTHFDVHWEKKASHITMHLPGEYNVYNALGSIQVALELGIEIDFIQRGLKKVRTLEGRWEVLQKKPFKVVVDFAHTPNSLEKMLEYARQNNQYGRLILVFGSAGKRDLEKREIMGEIAAKNADIIITTAEDPRGESVLNINRQIGLGIEKIGKVENEDFFSIEDRADAISRAIEMAEDGDTVIIAGKGHEKSMNIDGENEIPWSDQKVVEEVLNLSKFL